ncbi:hypothetical protein E1B28_012305 [Marasmius oreades]|uniref:Zn(2)-C6 fungal-type domain-containing protein n=1 Tax=Marasmius oreades TaxID=181124 RepID=A0A9P7UQM6_9AGAR|nr:uncharacterized protein E1B28_012305 [Marasmius oreades]KAG7088294.1 hypothetical protein E1B28_012305 [Marasmius oreades]
MFPALASPQDNTYVVDDNQLYHHSSPTYPHLRQYPTPSHFSSYSNTSFYRTSPEGLQQYDFDADVGPSLSRMKGVPSNTVIPSSITAPPPLPPQYIKSQLPLISSPPTPATEGSPDSDSFVPDPPKRKSRQKPKIELAPDQPTTTQGKQRKRVYVACAQCRARKIRCDGAKPVCHNCHQRANGNGECNYDSVPRRRGPDKTPGARQRMARDSRDSDSTIRRRRKRPETSSPTSTVDETRPSLLQPFPIVTDTGHGSISPASTGEYIQSPANYTPVDGMSHPLVSPTQNYSPSPTASQFPIHYEPNYSSMVPIGGTATRAYIRSLDDDDRDSGDNEDVARGPSLSFTKKIWYDSLCSLYAAPHSKYACQLSNSQRDRISQNINDDLRFLFRTSNYWFSFFHLPSFFGSFYDPVKRETIQPSLILAALAVSTFWQSSEIGKGAAGRRHSLRFRDEAQSALEASFNSGWIDESLAQAAWLLALFEICSHPEHSTARSVSAIMMLDAIIRSLALTDVDRNDPQASVFRVGGVPSIGVREQLSLSRTSECGYPSMPNGSYFTASGCSCQSVTLGTHWPQSLEHVPLWAQTPAWDPNWSEAEVKKESCRRLCWSASSLAAGHVSYAVATSSSHPDLFIGDPANYALLFSGESFSRSTSSKDSVWALYDRCFLLWNSCAKMRKSHDVTDAERADFAIKSWLEADNIETALNRHTCGIEKAFLFQGREYLFNTRMCITYEFQRYVPLATSHVSGLFHRKKAEEWLSHQTAVAQRIMNGLHTITGNSGNLLARRPFFTLWFMAQVSRALSLWQCDQSMVLALDVCKAFLPAIDYLSALWPCEEQRRRYDKLRARLDDACKAARVPLPPPPNLTPPNPSSVQSIV